MGELLNTGIPLWIFIIILGYATMISIFLFYRNPLPFPDRGHRHFAVINEKAVEATVVIMDRIGGLPERFTFDPVPTHITLLWDNSTAIIRHDSIIKEKGLPPNGISIPVDNPVLKAKEVVEILQDFGFKTKVHYDVLPETKDKFVMITSDAFDGWNLALRKHILKMGHPPNKRILFKKK